MNTDKEINQQATFAGGCFWHIEHAFETMTGVTEAVSGYTGGEVKNPSYEQVCSGKTGHYEAVRVFFLPDKTDYSVLLNTFWQLIDPTDPYGQFADRGSQYRTAVLYHSSTQRRIAEISKKMMVGMYEKPIVTEILPAQEFYRAEEYHQDYMSKNPYCACPHIKTAKQFPEYPLNSNRQEAIEALDPLQYKVVVEKGTERPFNNQYWNNWQNGLYVDLISGEPLFSSKDKYDSATGWPSFTRPVDPSNIVLRADNSFGNQRIEVRSSKGDVHLGHVFIDGPEPAGLRFCMNSAALRFIPWNRLVDEGYGQWLKVLQAAY